MRNTIDALDTPDLIPTHGYNWVTWIPTRLLTLWIPAALSLAMIWYFDRGFSDPMLFTGVGIGFGCSLGIDLPPKYDVHDLMKYGAACMFSTLFIILVVLLG